MTVTPEPCREPDCEEPGTLPLDAYIPAPDGTVRSPLRLTRGAYCLTHAAALLAAGDARPLAMGHVYGLDPEAQHLARVGPVGPSVSFDAYRCSRCGALLCAHCQQACPGDGADADTLRTLRAMTTHGETACVDCGGPLEGSTSATATARPDAYAGAGRVQCFDCQTALAAQQQARAVAREAGIDPSPESAGSTAASRLFHVLDEHPDVSEHLAARLCADWLLDDADTDDPALVAAAYARAWAAGDEYMTGEVLAEVEAARPHVGAAIRAALEEPGAPLLARAGDPGSPRLTGAFRDAADAARARLACRVCGVRPRVGPGVYCQQCLDAETDGESTADLQAAADVLEGLEGRNE